MIEVTIAGREVMRALERLGFAQIGQRGSHVKLRRDSATVIVPDHREIRKGTLSAILQQAGISVDELLGKLAQ